MIPRASPWTNWLPSRIAGAGATASSPPPCSAGSSPSSTCDRTRPRAPHAGFPRRILHPVLGRQRGGGRPVLPPPGLDFRQRGGFADHRLQAVRGSIRLQHFLVDAAPTLLAFYWKDAGFSFARLRRLPWLPFLEDTMPKTVIGLWGVWIPAVTIIYSLPPALQIPLFNIVLCFYALLFAARCTAGTRTDRGPGRPSQARA